MSVGDPGGVGPTSALSAQLDLLQRRLQVLEACAREALAYGQASYNLQLAQSETSERALLLQGRIAAHGLPDRLRTLSDAEFRVSSQWGEDGIIEWLVKHVPLPNNRFIEFGVETFREANCRFLMQNRNWRGLVIDSNSDQVATLRADKVSWMYDITAVSAFITAENINELLERAGFTGPIGLLSVDIDGNDYWVLDRVSAVDPAIVICEYNPIFGDKRPISVPYKQDRTRFADHPSGLYYGTSIGALRLWAKNKGYTLVGSNSFGSNAFFVRNDVASAAMDLIQDVEVYPSACRDSRNEQGQLTYVGGLSRLALIQDTQVVDVESGETVRLGSIDPIYSEGWTTAMV
jgi:hypothetical protein